MTIEKLLKTQEDFSPELFFGSETHEVYHLADPWLSFYDADAVYVAADYPLTTDGFKNAGTVIVSEDLLSFVSPFTLNVIVAEPCDMEGIKERLEQVL